MSYNYLTSQQLLYNLKYEIANIVSFLNTEGAAKCYHFGPD
jgi:hypothetical protein